MAGNGADLGITLFEQDFERRAWMFDGRKFGAPGGQSSISLRAWQPTN
jgi:hypothetical protein